MLVWPMRMRFRPRYVWLVCITPAAWRVLADRFIQWLSFRIPRKLAYFAYIRVTACTAWDFDVDGPRFDATCKAWEAGKGR